jgi:hypothetical protein
MALHELPVEEGHTARPECPCGPELRTTLFQEAERLAFVHGELPDPAPAPIVSLEPAHPVKPSQVQPPAGVKVHQPEPVDG